MKFTNIAAILALLSIGGAFAVEPQNSRNRDASRQATDAKAAAEESKRHAIVDEALDNIFGAPAKSKQEKKMKAEEEKKAAAEEEKKAAAEKAKAEEEKKKAAAEKAKAEEEKKKAAAEEKRKAKVTADRDVVTAPADKSGTMSDTMKYSIIGAGSIAVLAAVAYATYHFTMKAEETDLDL